MPAAEWATLAAAILGGGAVTAAVNGFFGRPKTNADVSTAYVQNTKEVVSIYRQSLEDIQKNLGDRVLELTREVDRLGKQDVEQRTELKALRAELGMLARRERENLVWQASVIAYHAELRAKAEAEGRDLPPMPEPPAPRREFTRAEDQRPIQE